MTEGLPKNQILGEETGSKWHTGDRQCRNYIGPVGLGHVRLEPAHLAHVLLAAESVNNAARTEEQAGFEERMGKDMEDRRAEGTHADGEKHVAQLAHG